MRLKKKENNFIMIQNARINVKDISCVLFSVTADEERGEVDILFKNGIEKKINYDFKNKKQDFFKLKDKVNEILEVKDLNPENHKYY